MTETHQRTKETRPRLPTKISQFKTLPSDSMQKYEAFSLYIRSMNWFQISEKRDDNLFGCSAGIMAFCHTMFGSLIHDNDMC